MEFSTFEECESSNFRGSDKNILLKFLLKNKYKPNQCNIQKFKFTCTFLIKYSVLTQIWYDFKIMFYKTSSVVNFIKKTFISTKPKFW